MDDFGMGYALGSESNNSNNNCGGWGLGGLGGDGGIWGLLILVLLLGGGRGFGGFGGFGGIGCGLGVAELQSSFNFNDLQNSVRGIQQGIADSTYALNNSITSGFHGVDNAICNLGYNVQSGFNQIGHQISDCCCETQRAIDGVNYNTSKGFYDLSNTINMQTRDIIDNNNANYRSMMDFFVQEKLSSKDAQIAQLQNQLSQSNQNAVIGARIDAAVAEVLRRTGNDCPTAAYLVQPPTPVNFPTNGCGTVQFGGFAGNGCGCGYGNVAGA